MKEIIDDINNNYINLHSPGYVINYINDNDNEEITLGKNMYDEGSFNVTNETLYDIASLTKLFTSTLIYTAYEEGLIKLEDTIYSIDNNFINLKDITVRDLLSHNTELWTNGYLGSASTKEEFYNILYSASIKSEIPTYIDSHYIILGIILEKIYNKSYKDILYDKIINRLNLKYMCMNPTSNNIASCNHENRGDIVIDTPIGIVHDTKARNLKKLGIYTAHAGIFINSIDLVKFLRTFIYDDERILKKKTIKLMLKHDDRNKYNYNILHDIYHGENVNEMYERSLLEDKKLKLPKTYNYMGTRYRNDINKINEIPKNASNNTIVFSGYTGPAILIDFDNKIIISVLCNIVHNNTLGRIERKDKTFEIINKIYRKKTS